MNKPLDKLTISELLDRYGRTIQALTAFADDAPFDQRQYRQLRTDQAAIEVEARRRDQATWMPAQPAKKEDWDLYA